MADNTQPSTNGLAMELADDLDASLEADVTQDPTQPSSMNLDGANDPEPSAPRNGVTDAAAALESRIPAKKDATLREFLGKMDEYAPIVRFPLPHLYLKLESKLIAL
jgi:transcription initiation factor TFIID subunit 10